MKSNKTNMVPLNSTYIYWYCICHFWYFGL